MCRNCFSVEHTEQQRLPSLAIVTPEFCANVVGILAIHQLELAFLLAKGVPLQVDGCVQPLEATAK